jgi:hypothetical protein
MVRSFSGLSNNYETIEEYIHDSSYYKLNKSPFKCHVHAIKKLKGEKGSDDLFFHINHLAGLGRNKSIEIYDQFHWKRNKTAEFASSGLAHKSMGCVLMKTLIASNSRLQMNQR